jgi:hypothetical protein
METHEYWRARKAAEYIGLSESTLAEMRVLPTARINLRFPMTADLYIVSIALGCPLGLARRALGSGERGEAGAALSLPRRNS